MNEHLVFTLAGKTFAISIECLQELSGQIPITPVPGLEPPFKGVINLRDRVIPIFNMEEFLGLQTEQGQEINYKIMVFNCNDITFAAEVAQVEGVLSIGDDQISTGEGVTEESPFIKGFFKTPDGKIIQVIDTEKFLNEMSRLLKKDQIQNHTISINNVPFEDINKQLTTIHKKEKSLQRILEAIEYYLNAISSGNVQEAEEALLRIKKAAEEEVLEEVRKLIDSVHATFNDFKTNLDTRLRMLAESAFTGTSSDLENVIRQTEEASSKTISIIEKQLSAQSEMVKCLDSISEKTKSLKKNSVKEDLETLRRLIEDLNMDLMEALVAQQFQDLTGQILKKAVSVIREVEARLEDLIQTFGIQPNKNFHPTTDMVRDQSEVDELLNQYNM